MTTGTGEAIVALIMSRMAESKPPGVSNCTMKSGAPRDLASASERTKKSLVAGPIASLISIITAFRSGVRAASSSAAKLVAAISESKTTISRQQRLDIASSPVHRARSFTLDSKHDALRVPLGK